METTILLAPSYGDAQVLRYSTQVLPLLSAGYARIAVKAAGINPIDARRMTGEFKHAPMPQTFGTEFAGVIVDLPEGESFWKVGNAVLGSGGSFTHATHIDVPLSNLIAKPEQISWQVAGSIAGVAQTAMTVLQELGNMDSLLIHGGSGGVGSIAIQLAKEQGVTVVATASAANQDYLKQIGAIPVVYGPGLQERIDAVFPGLFDASIDMIGNEEATQVSLEKVKPTGVMGTIAGRPLSSPKIVPMWVKRNLVNLKYVVDGVAAGRFNWVVERSYPFEDAQQAYAAILEGHTKGKSVLTF